MNRDVTAAHTEHVPAGKKNAKRAAVPNTGMRLWMVTLRDPRKHRERKVWVTEVIALATSARGAELAVRRDMPALFAYEPGVHVEPIAHHTVKHLTYQAEPRRGE